MVLLFEIKDGDDDRANEDIKKVILSDTNHFVVREVSSFTIGGASIFDEPSLIFPVSCGDCGKKNWSPPHEKSRSKVTTLNPEVKVKGHDLDPRGHDFDP